MEFKGKEINNLKELEVVLTEDMDITTIIDRLSEIPKEIQDKLVEQQDGLSDLKQIIDTVEVLNQPTSKENLMMIVKQTYPNMAGTDAEAELLLERKDIKKRILAKAKELGTETSEMFKSIKRFYDSITKIDIPEAAKEGKKVLSKVKNLFVNGNLKDSGKKLGYRLMLSMVLTGMGVLLFPFGSLAFYAFLGGASATAALTAKKAKESTVKVAKKLKLIKE